MTDTTTSHTTPALPLTPGRWALDPTHSTVAFAVRHLGISKVRGTFADLDVDVVVGEDLATTTVAATVAVASIDTGNADRDAHLRSEELLDVERRPTLAFRSTGIRPDGDGWALDGDLTLGAVTTPVSLAVELGGVAVFPIDGRRHAGFTATGEVRRSTLGLRFGPLDAALGDRLALEIDLQLVEPDA